MITGQESLATASTGLHAQRQVSSEAPGFLTASEIELLRQDFRQASAWMEQQFREHPWTPRSRSEIEAEQTARSKNSPTA